MQHGVVVVGVGDAELHAHAAAGDEGLVQKVLLKVAHRAVPAEALGGAVEFSADEHQVHRLGRGQDVGNLQRVGDHRQLPVSDLPGDEPRCGGAVQKDEVPGLDQRVALLGDLLLFTPSRM